MPEIQLQYSDLPIKCNALVSKQVNFTCTFPLNAAADKCHIARDKRITKTNDENTNKRYISCDIKACLSETKTDVETL